MGVAVGILFLASLEAEIPGSSFQHKRHKNTFNVTRVNIYTDKRSRGGLWVFRRRADLDEENTEDVRLTLLGNGVVVHGTTLHPYKKLAQTVPV